MQNLAGEKGLTIELQVFSVISWLIVLSLLQLSLYPSLKKTFGSYAFPVAYPASLLAFTLLSWYCGLVHVPVHLALLPFIALLAYHLFFHHYSLDELKAEWRWETLFMICFFLMLDVRFVNPTISYAEKFMDHAFLASVMRNPVIPPLDPWFAGGFLNVYYYLGYWMFGCLGIVTGVPSNIAFNLALPTIFGMAALSMYAIGTLALDRYRWLPLLVLFIPNPSFFSQIIQGKVWSSVFWDSTRTIANTINEYPLFSFLWGDVHAHVISLFNQAFLIFLLFFAYMRWEYLGTREKCLVGIFTAVSLGSMPLINTWDVLIYAPFTVLVTALILRRTWNTAGRNFSIMFLVAVPVLAVLSYLPFYLQLQTHTGGIGIVHTPSDPVEFLLVNGLFLGIIILVLRQDILRRPWLLLIAVPFLLAGYGTAALIVVPAGYMATRIVTGKDIDFPGLLAFFGLAILLFCELFYLKDNMGDTFFRMNTVFKTYLPAWLMLGTAAFSMVGKWVSETRLIPHIPSRTTAIAAIIVVSILFFLPFVIPVSQNYGSGTLDGLAYLHDSHPGDAAAVAYLRTLTGNEIIVEAEGGDYTYYSRISSFTGIPGIIGMPFHEYMWRSDDTGWFSSRLADIKSIYEEPEKTVPLMKKYQATLLYVGAEERERYNVQIPSAGLEKIYSAQGTEIYRPL
jgi:YYY domain-containing protein